MTENQQNPTATTAIQPYVEFLPTMWKRAFVDTLKEHGIITVAAQAVGVTLAQVRNARKLDTEFDVFVREAVEIANGNLEFRARQRALAGSDPLMIKMLEANLPEKYGKQPERTDDVHVKAYINFSPDMWDRADVTVVEVKPQAKTDESESDTDSDLRSAAVATTSPAG